MANNEMFPEEWQNTETTLSRKEFADIITREVAAVLHAVRAAGGDDELYEMFKELLLQFCAGIGSEMFPEKEDMEVDE